MVSKKVFLIDDEPLILKLFQLFLRKAKEYDVAVFISGEEALTEIENGNIPDVLITDLMMPGMSGYELIEKLVQTGYQNKIKLGYCSAFASLQAGINEKDQEKLKKYNFPYYPKPVREDFLNFIKNVSD